MAQPSTIAQLARELAVLQERVQQQEVVAQDRLAERRRIETKLFEKVDANEGRIATIEATIGNIRFSGRALLGLLGVLTTISGFIGSLLARLH